MDENNELQDRIDAIGDLLHAYAAEIVCCCPLLVLFVLGANNAPIWGYALTLVLLVVLILICNPFGLLSNFLSPQSRKFLSAGVVLALLAIIMPWLSLYARACLMLLAAIMIALAVWKRKSWLYDWQVQQSPEVDKALAHLAKKGGEWQAGKYWKKHGMQQTRALLHQGMGVECNEAEIDRTYKAIFFLAFASGERESKSRIKKLKAQLEERDATIAKQKQDLYSIENQDVKIWELQQENSQLQFKVDSLMREKAQADNKAAALAEQVKDLSLTMEERDAAIVAYVDAGHSYSEAGKKYGLTKNGATAAYKRAKQAATAAN